MEMRDKMPIEEIIALAKECGFDQVKDFDPSVLKFRVEVRDMCAANRCQSYDKNWSCPPACATLEDAALKAASYKEGILVQSTGVLEDPFDLDTMMGTEQLQKDRFLKLVKEIRNIYPNCLPMATGACTICSTCTYPSKPCRFPKQMISSMEAYGLVVSDTCSDAGMKYYYGPGTITYTSCILIR